MDNDNLSPIRVSLKNPPVLRSRVSIANAEAILTFAKEALRTEAYVYILRLKKEEKSQQREREREGERGRKKGQRPGFSHAYCFLCECVRVSVCRCVLA